MASVSQNLINSGDICYACLRMENMRNVTDSNLDHRIFLNKFKTCTGLELNSFDSFPLCEDCILKTQQFHSFREMCLQSYATIQQALTKTKVTVNDQNPQCIFADSNDEETQIQCDAAPGTDAKSDTSLTTSTTCFDVTSLVKHEELVHCSKDYRCAICDETFNSKISLTEHVQKHQSDSENPKIFGCGTCVKSYANMPNLQVHLYSHLGLKPYKCQLCSKDFTKLTSLKLHTNNVHQKIRNYLCYECGKKFSTAVVLRRHQSSHKGPRPYQCQKCPNSFSVARDLTIHMRIHTGEKPYLCSTCGKAFRRMSHLNVHRRTHTGEKPYICSFCGKSFSQSGDWRTHERLHTGVKPYSCPVCGKKFNQSSGMTTHMKNHNGVTLKCNLCDRVFVKAESLKKHILQHEEERKRVIEKICTS